jgi:hypothetical protein
MFGPVRVLPHPMAISHPEAKSHVSMRCKMIAASLVLLSCPAASYEAPWEATPWYCTHLFYATKLALVFFWCVTVLTIGL